MAGFIEDNLADITARIDQLAIRKSDGTILLFLLLFCTKIVSLLAGDYSLMPTTSLIGGQTVLYQLKRLPK